MAPYTTDLCTSPACIHIASDILLGLAPNYTEIDPCTNFDQLVCGDWASHHGIPAGWDSIESLTTIRAQIADSARAILEGSYPSGSEAGWVTVNLTKEQVKADEEIFAKITDAYQVCMNYTATEEDGLKFLATFVEKVVDAFPAKTDNNKYPAAMGKTITLLESYGIPTTQRLFQIQNSYDPEEMILGIYPPSFDVPSDGEAVLEYLELAAKLISTVHPDNITEKEAYSRMESVLEWQLKVAQVLQTTSEAESDSGGYLSLDMIQKAAPQLNYEYVVRQLAPKDYKADKVETTSLQFFANYSQIITETPPEVIQTFFIWKAISALSPYVESQLPEAYNTFQTKLNGEDPKSLQPRWQKCLEMVNEGVSWINGDTIGQNLIGPTGLTWILSRFFLNKHYSVEAKKVTSEIVDNLEAAFLERIESREWATKEVKKASAEKLHAVMNKISWPTDPEILDPVFLSKYYADAEVTAVHMNNALSFAKVNVAKNWASLGKPPSKGQFKYSTLTVNAYYNGLLNEIVLLSGVQQFPLYDVGFPSYLLYGGMGSVVGHEITHGFDNNGRLKDATGNETKWWDDASIEAFENKTKCFIEQYNKFTITAPNGTQVHVNGQNTLGENIADAGGVVTSFAAWKEHQRKTGQSKSLPGLTTFTPEQLFFIKWGQSWCSNMPAASALNRLLKDTHSPGGARIKLTLDNSEEFKKAFNCPKKEPVCELW
ncbi:hypothetical protein BGZ63DRAFT_404435 [Mariannaea sp. PMI_226]|nr:hypothetical protein BGZ63DRAFT_404435 [Mariannaea sp. PMI_226]